MSVERVNPATLAPPIGDLYTQVVVAKGTRRVHIAGQVAINQSGDLVGAGDYGAQAKQAWQNVKDAISAVGGSGSDITRYTIFVVDHKPELVEVIFAAGFEVFEDAFPKAAGVLAGVQSLGYAEWLIEIEAEATLD